MKREPKSSLSKGFSTGSELWMHRIGLLLVAIRNIVLCGLLFGLVAGILYLWFAVRRQVRTDIVASIFANTRQMLYMTANPMDYSQNGETIRLPVERVVELTDYVWNEVGRLSYHFTIVMGTAAICVIIIASVYWYEYGRTEMEDKDLRGATLATGPELKKLIGKNGDNSPYELAGVPLRKGAENLHTLISGAQGTGKSQQFFNLMKQIRARKKRMIVYDPSGEFTQAFYRPGIDIIMNPFDERSPNWNIWQDIREEYHFDNMASGLIPDPSEADPFWAMAGREVFRDVARVLHSENRMSNRNLYSAIALNSLDAIHQLLKNTAGASYVDPATERTGMSLKMTVQNQLSAFRYLRDDGPLFSIREWIMQDDSESWMFISTREEMRDAIKPVLSLWVDIAIKAVLSLEPIHRERLWFGLDELPTLQKLDILKLALTNTRKYGLCILIGVQDFSQVYEIYGQYLASTILSGCQTKLLLRVTDGEAARKLADLIGQIEIVESDESLSYGLNSQRDGVSIAKRRQLRDLVLTSEITRLPDMTGYLVTPGDYPIAKVSYQYVETEKKEPGFVKRDVTKGRFGVNGAAIASGNTPASGESPAPPDDWIANPAGLAAPVGGPKPAEPGRQPVDPDTGEILPDERSAWLPTSTDQDGKTR